MRLQILDQVHLSSVSANTLAAGAIVDVSDSFGKELLKKHPDKFCDLGSAETVDDQALRQDGPTLQEFMAAGYSPRGYPPAGYASKADAAELERAIAEEQDRERAVADEKAGREAAEAAAAAEAAEAAEKAKAEQAGKNKAETAPKNKSEGGK